MTKSAAVLLLVLFLFSSSYAHSGKHESGSRLTKHFNDTLFALSEKGQVSLEILLDEKEHRIGRGVVGIVVHDSHDEDVEGAKLTVTITGVMEPLKVNEKGDGLYLVPDTSLPKDGKWEMKIVVKKRKIDDSAVFVFPDVLEEKMPAGKYDVDLLKRKK